MNEAHEKSSCVLRWNRMKSSSLGPRGDPSINVIKIDRKNAENKKHI